MVVLLDLLTTTQPHTIPWSELADLEKWEERSKPLVPVDHTKKGDNHDPTIYSTNSRGHHGHSLLVPCTTATTSRGSSNLGFSHEKIDSIELARCSVEQDDGVLDPSQLYPEITTPESVVSPEECHQLYSFSMPYAYTSTVKKRSSPRSLYSGHVVMSSMRRAPPNRSESASTLDSERIRHHHSDFGQSMTLHAGDSDNHHLHHHFDQSTGSHTEDFTLTPEHDDYSFENEGFLNDFSMGDSSTSSTKRYITPCSTPMIHRLSVSTEMSFHTARDDVLEPDADAMHQSLSPIFDMELLCQGVQQSVTVINAGAYAMPIGQRNSDHWKPEHESSHSCTSTMTKSQDQGSTHREGLGSRRFISEINRKTKLATNSRLLYGQGRKLRPKSTHMDLVNRCKDPPVSKHKTRGHIMNESEKSTPTWRQATSKSALGKPTREQRRSRVCPSEGQKSITLPHSPMVPYSDFSNYSRNGSYYYNEGYVRNPGGHGRYSREHAKASELVLKPSSPTAVLCAGKGLNSDSNQAVYLPEEGVQTYHDYLTYTQSEHSKNTVWSVPATLPGTVYRVPELKLGKSTYV